MALVRFCWHAICQVETWWVIGLTQNDGAGHCLSSFQFFPFVSASQSVKWLWFDYLTLKQQHMTPFPFTTLSVIIFASENAGQTFTPMFGKQKLTCIAVIKSHTFFLWQTTIHHHRYSLLGYSSLANYWSVVFDSPPASVHYLHGESNGLNCAHSIHT